MAKKVNPSVLRGEFLDGMKPFLDEFLEVARGERNSFTSENNFAITQSWDLLKEIIKVADDPVPIAWTDTTTRTRVDEVLNQVASGTLTPDEGKRLLALVSMGFEMTDLQDIMRKIDAINSNSAV